MKTALVVLVLAVQLAAAYNNGYGLKPFLGWQTWCSVGPCGTDILRDRQIRETAQAMVDNGMKDLGYEWVVLDDGWHPTRDSNGTLIPNATFFPNGMKPVVDYVHSLGLKFGLYTSVGTLTCHGGWSPGSYGHYTQDADLFASWGVDYVKVDWCGQKDTVEGHKELSAAMNQTGRPMVLELCRGTYQGEAQWGYAPSIAQVWRASSDHHDSFSSTMGEVAALKGKGAWSGPYGWAYLDMMMTGGEGCDNLDFDHPQHCPKQTDNEYRTEFSLYAVLASPMMIGTDIRNMTAIMKELIYNKHVYDINQDYLAVPGEQTKSCGEDVWVRKLSNGQFAVALPNLGSSTANMSICFSDIEWPHDSAVVYDVWRNTTGTFTKQATRDVATHDTFLALLSAP